MSNTITNKNHPELRAGEVFICNTANETASQYTFPTKRVGKVAYDVNGDNILHLYPVFAMRNEHEQFVYTQAVNAFRAVQGSALRKDGAEPGIWQYLALSRTIVLLSYLSSFDQFKYVYGIAKQHEHRAGWDIEAAAYIQIFNDFIYENKEEFLYV